MLGVARRLDGINRFEFFDGLLNFAHLVVSKSKVKADSVIGWLRRQSLLVFLNRFGVAALVRQCRSQIRANRHRFGMSFQIGLITGDRFGVVTRLVKFDGPPERLLPGFILRPRQGQAE